MSGNKMTDPKVNEDLNVDSGFLSGYISEPISETLDLPRVDKDSGGIESRKSDDKVCSEQLLDMDSGIQCLSEVLSDVKIVEEESVEEITAQLRRTQDNMMLLRPHQHNLPLELLFQQDDDGDTQLHIAAVHGLEKSVSILIRVCPNKELLNTRNDSGLTALHLAVMSRNHVITRMLVLGGAALGVRDRCGETPLHKATALGHIPCIQALLAPVMEQPQRKRSTVLDQKNYNGQSCVHVAASLGLVDPLHLLVYYGADVNSRENMAGWTALHIAASRGDTRLVQYLQRCTGVDAHATDYARRTPRRLARHNRAAALFVKAEDSDTDDSDDDIEYDSETESLFEKYASKTHSVVA